MTNLRIRLFGQVELRHGDEPLPSLDSARAQSLLAYLLLHRDAPQQRQRLAFLLWPDSTESQARTNLRHLLHTLRRALPDPDRFLEVTQRTLRWRTDAPYWLDVAAFEQLLAQADRDADAGATRRSLELAVETYTADLLEDHYDEWLPDHRAGLRQRFVEALERLANLCEAAGEPSQAVGYAERLVRHDPLREDGYRLVMRLAAAQGDRARALRAYHVCVSTLERELGVAPSAATLTAYQALLRPDPTVTSRPASQATERTRLVGRAAERETLTAAWRATERGRAQLVVVTGEPGIGKSRLVEEFRAWCARRGALTAEARSYAAEGSLAYGPVVTWLRSQALSPRVHRLDGARRTELARVLPELLIDMPDVERPQPLPEGEQRQRLYDAVAAAVLGSARPTLLVADDLHWSDSQTAALLHYLLRVEPAAPLLVAATLRREQTAHDHSVHELLAGAQALDRLTTIELGPLSREETAELAGVSPTHAQRLFGETEGNPLFVVEAVRAGWPSQAGLSPKVQAVIQARLAQLSQPAGALVGVASAIGREFNTGVLADASGADEDSFVASLDELWRRRIVRERGADGYDFSHDKIREVAYGGLGPVRRRYHRRIAEALQRRHTGDPRSVPGAVASHYERAGATDEAVLWYGRAAEAQQRLYANADAVRLGQRAVDLLRTLPESPGRDASELDLLISSLAPLGTLEGYAAARLATAHQRAVQLATALDVELAPALVRSLALEALIAGDFERARGFGDRLRTRGERDHDEVLVVEGEYVLGIAAFWRAEFDCAREHFESAVNRYQPEHHAVHIVRYGLDPQVICLSRLANTYWFLGQSQAAEQARDRALATAKQVGDPYSRAVALIFAAVLAIDMEDQPGVLRYAAAVVDSRVAGRQLDYSSAVLAGYVDVLDGHHSPGLGRIRTAIDESRGVESAPGMQAVLARVLLAACVAADDRAGGWQAAQRLLDMSGGARVWAAEARRRHTEFATPAQPS